MPNNQINRRKDLIRLGWSQIKATVAEHAVVAYEPILFSLWRRALRSNLFYKKYGGNNVDQIHNWFRLTVSTIRNTPNNAQITNYAIRKSKTNLFKLIIGTFTFKISSIRSHRHIIVYVLLNTDWGRRWPVLRPAQAVANKTQTLYGHKLLTGCCCRRIKSWSWPSLLVYT